jgi:hypothetical protein
MTLIEFVENNFSLDNYLVAAISLGIIWIVVYDFYHLLFSAITSWFTRR